MRGVSGRQRWWSARWLCVALVVGTGCSSAFAREDGLYRHRALGFQIGSPPGADGYWSRVSLPRVDLGFRGANGETMSLATRCGRPIASSEILARHLRFGLPDAVVQRAGPFPVGGEPGWMQVFEAPAGSATVVVKSVTVVLKDCILDFVLAARSRFEPAERAFDGWLQTFQPGGKGLGEGEP